MRNTYSSVLALFLAGSNALSLSRLNMHRDQLLGTGVQAGGPGMRGDEDLGETITIDGQKFHYH